MIYKIFHIISARIYKQADKILITSSMFQKYLNDELKISNKRISYLPQYAEELFDPKRCLKKPDEYTDLMFAGNIGKVQNVEIILKVADKLRNKKVRFHIVGDGSDFDRLKKIKEKLNLDNVTFYGRQPLEEMPSYYSMADAMIVTLEDDPTLSLTLPGKVQTYMAAGKPIIGSINGETASVIKAAECGYCSSAENENELTEIILKFISYKDKEHFSLSARKYYEDNFRKELFIQKLEKELIK